ncbi:M48 family metalloprotease [Micromonospora sp. WMMD1082]|uniref:M48 family metalloprotease n=1 Tax=Micromonospora sp. WMMD1082 TaxID=3016104 RepID=UPI002416DD5B|nr:M48 family metalloprotease [Micromonospora sp. WMMD1082]MDG4797597.1 M48 family metalloprotease [Micromonospora sp. WMMD1082]
MVERFERRTAECGAAFEDAVARLAAEGTITDADRAAVQREFRACLRPAFAGQYVGAAAGLGTLTVVTTIGYLAHPQWLIHRRRLRRIDSTAAPALVGELDQLYREAGLTRAPRWLLAPRRRTTGGQAFGLPGRRCVQLDAGLVLLRRTDPPAFRAVVRHELAHLRNRDVDLTYLTMAVWWAFLAVAILPRLVLALFPGLLGVPGEPLGRTTLRTLAALLVMTVLVYGVRNALLRIRERHADAFAAGHTTSDGALARVLGRLPPPRRWYGRWGTHPLPADRLRTVRDPTTLLVPAYGVLVAAGLPAGALTADLSVTAGLRFGLDARLGIALLGLFVGPWLGGLLAVTLWQNVAARADEARRVPMWFGGPVVLAAAFLAGTLLSLQQVTSATGLPGIGGLDSWLVAAAVLAAGAVLLGAWVDAAARAADAGGRPSRWTPPATVATAALVAGTALMVWLPLSRLSYGFAFSPGTGPATGPDPGWYAATAAIVGGQLGPATHFVFHPLTLPALALLWLVPVLAARRRADVTAPLRRAILVGLGTGAVAAVAAAALPVLAPRVLPVGVRSEPPSGTAGEPYVTVLGNTVIAVGSLAVAVAVLVLAFGRGRLRPAGSVLAAVVSGLLATGGYVMLGVPAYCLADVTDPGWCLPVPSAVEISRVAHWIIVQGVLLAAVPLVGFVIAAAALRPDVRPAEEARPAGGEIRSARHVRGPTVAVLAAVLVATAWLAWEMLPLAGEYWRVTGGG